MWAVRQFSVAHLAALGVLLVAAVLAVWMPRQHPGPWIRWVAWAIAVAIFVGWAGEYLADVIVGTWTIKYTLPLQLTDAVSVVSMIALVTGGQQFIELVYFWTFSASLQAVLTPDLSSTFPDVFYFTYFLYHIGSWWRRACWCLAVGAIPALVPCGARTPPRSGGRRSLGSPTWSAAATTCTWPASRSTTRCSA